MRSGRNAAEYTVSVVDRTGKAIHTVSTSKFLQIDCLSISFSYLFFAV